MIIFAGLIYNEIIIVNMSSLNESTKESIEIRSVKDFQLAIIKEKETLLY